MASALETASCFTSLDLAPVVPKVDSAIHWINFYLVDKCYWETN